ncbi:hypothetical protein PHYPSEUDO_010535 [Phytophthora pseudosyringae]|uniref:Transmembrane protein n=1 Tax=Phytophthora pseudosyringae TaxID=221518 RepID=A0A8T1VD06_9STRA|nr:hypothetical protein PHYPSEUDO_010535 [Phytophthora pseudosyringae]
MIQPAETATAFNASSAEVNYQVVAWGNELPAFNPLLMVKAVALSPNKVRRFNHVVLQFSVPLEHSIVFAVVLRFATFLVSAEVGRILAPVAALLHVFPIVVFAAGMRVEYMKLVMRTFDFGVLLAANTLWAVVFSTVLRDARSVLVVVCWVNFTNSLLQETHLRNTVFMVAVMLGELLFFAMLMLWLSLDFVDGVQHSALLTTRGRTLSTKDVLLNVLGTMTMLSLRNLYRRYQQLKHKSGTSTPALGYRCKIALTESSVLLTSNIVVGPSPTDTRTRSSLQMRLSGESERYDARDTVWPRVGAVTPLARWKLGMLYAGGMVGGLLAVPPLFLPENTIEGTVSAVVGVTMSAAFCGFFTSCSQRQLLKRVVSSFHFLFLELQVFAGGICLVDMYRWQWAPACGVASAMIFSHTFLTVDALTPIMKRRLRFKFWIFVAGIALFLVVLVVLLVDIFVVGHWDLRDRAVLKLSIFGHNAVFCVAPFLFGRVVTVFVWSVRYAYVALTRLDDNALILLRGNVEFDYESWKQQVICAPRPTAR